MFILPDLQLSSTTCWISPPKKGTLTSSSCSKLRAEARPVTRGTYFRELVGPAQFLMTNVRKFTQRKSLKGWGLVRRTHFRYRCLSMDRQGISGTLTPIGKKKQKGLWQDDRDWCGKQFAQWKQSKTHRQRWRVWILAAAGIVSLFSDGIGKAPFRFLNFPRMWTWGM